MLDCTLSAERIAELRAAQDTLDRMEVIVPQSGTIVGLSFHTPGGVLLEGEPILDIVPKNDNLVVSARIRPVDIDVVHECSPAEVRLTEYNMRTTPPLSGTITKVSADRFTDAADGLDFYQIEVDVQRRDLSDGELYPGMSAEVYVVTGKRTALDYLIKPVRDSFRRGILEE